ncbi:MAG: hypothetical protein ACJ79K_18325 [Gemmatimonadaceae bacterium]
MRTAIVAAMIVVVTIVVAAPRLAHAQATRRATTAAAHDCAPRAASRGAAFAWGNEGGTLKRRANRLWADGSIQPAGGARTAPNGALADSARVLAAEARRSPFWTTKSPPITRPTRNPDLAREYVEVHLRCGSHRALYMADAEPPAFAALVRRLNAIIGLATRR